MKPLNNPPDVVAADWAVTFSLGPKYPPPQAGVSLVDNGLMMANEKIAPKIPAPNVHPTLSPRYILDAAYYS